MWLSVQRACGAVDERTVVPIMDLFQIITVSPDTLSHLVHGYLTALCRCLSLMLWHSSVPFLLLQVGFTC